MKYSYFDVSTSKTDAEIVGDASFEEEDELKLYTNDLVEALEYFKTMLSERKDEIFSTTDDNGFAGIGSSEYLTMFLMTTWKIWQTIGPILRKMKISFIQR